MTCNHCDNTGFLNIQQLPEVLRENFDCAVILKWITENKDHDVSVCDCCGNGETWYGTPGEHFMGGDHSGSDGPYSYNGGLPECY